MSEAQAMPAGGLPAHEKPGVAVRGALQYPTGSVFQADLQPRADYRPHWDT